MVARFCGIQQAESVMLHVPFQCFQHFSSTHAETYWFGEFSQQVACAFTERWRSTHTWSLHPPRLFPLPQLSRLFIVFKWKPPHDDRLSSFQRIKIYSPILLFSLYIYRWTSCPISSIFLWFFYFLNNSNFIFERKKEKTTKLDFCHTVSLLLLAKRKKNCVQRKFVHTLIVMGLN